MANVLGELVLQDLRLSVSWLMCWNSNNDVLENIFARSDPSLLHFIIARYVLNIQLKSLLESVKDLPKQYIVKTDQNKVTMKHLFLDMLNTRIIDELFV